MTGQRAKGFFHYDRWFAGVIALLLFGGCAVVLIHGA